MTKDHLTSTYEGVGKMCEKLGYSAEGASDYVAVERNYVELYDAKQSSNYDKFFNTKT